MECNYNSNCELLRHLYLKFYYLVQILDKTYDLVIFSLRDNIQIKWLTNSINNNMLSLLSSFTMKSKINISIVPGKEIKELYLFWSIIFTLDNNTS